MRRPQAAGKTTMSKGIKKKKSSAVFVLPPPFRISWPCFDAMHLIFYHLVILHANMFFHGKPGCTKFPCILNSALRVASGVVRTPHRCSGVQATRDEQMSIIVVGGKTIYGIGVKESMRSPLLRHPGQFWCTVAIRLWGNRTHFLGSGTTCWVFLLCGFFFFLSLEETGLYWKAFRYVCTLSTLKACPMRKKERAKSECNIISEYYQNGTAKCLNACRWFLCEC